MASATAIGSCAGCCVFIRQFFPDKIHSSELIYAQNANLDGISQIYHILYGVYSFFGELGDMEQSFFSREKLDECAKIHDALHSAVVGFPYFHLAEDVFDELLRQFRSLCIGGRNGYSSIVLYIQVCAGLFDDASDYLSPRTDQFADAILIDLNCRNSRGVGRYVGTSLQMSSKLLLFLRAVRIWQPFWKRAKNSGDKRSLSNPTFV